MSNEVTKGCNITEAEVMELMNHHGRNMQDSTEDRMERLKYLASRLKTFRETNNEEKPKAEAAPAPAAPAWPSSNG